MAMSLLLVAMNKGQECGRLSIGMISELILSGLCAGAFIAREEIRLASRRYLAVQEPTV